jgi:hypothetical protein
MHLQRMTAGDRVADRVADRVTDSMGDDWPDVRHSTGGTVISGGSVGFSAERVVGTRETSLAVDLKTSVHRAPNTRQACSAVGVQKIIRWRQRSGPGLLGDLSEGGGLNSPSTSTMAICCREYHSSTVTKPLLRLAPRSWTLSGSAWHR